MLNQKALTLMLLPGHPTVPVQCCISRPAPKTALRGLRGSTSVPAERWHLPKSITCSMSWWRMASHSCAWQRR